MSFAYCCAPWSPVATASSPIELSTELESPNTEAPGPLTEGGLATPTTPHPPLPLVRTLWARMSVFKRLAAAAADSPPPVPDTGGWGTPPVGRVDGAAGRLVVLVTGLGEGVVVVPARDASV